MEVPLKSRNVRDETPPEKIGQLVRNWHFWESLVYSGLEFKPEGEIQDPLCTTKAYYPRVKNLRAMAEESLRLVATALERLTVNQATQGWARHLKAPDVFKPDSRDNELKLWGDWKFSFMNYIKGIDPTMANDMDLVERDLEASYDMDDMTDETKSRAVRLYSLLTSYRRQRPLKLIQYVK